MDTTVLQPGAGQTVVATNDHQHHNRDHGYNHGHSGFDAVEARADFRALTNEVERFGSVNGDRINTVGAAGALASSRTNELVQGAACHTDQIVQAGFGGVHDRLCDSTGRIVGAVDRGAVAAALAACKTGDEIAAVYASLQKQLSDTATATVVGFKDAQAISYQIEGRASLDAAKNAAALGLQATTHANAISVEATKNFYALSLENQKFASAAELRAQQIASTAAAQAAECCCELKALIIEQNTATRAQAADFRMRDLESQLARIPRGIAVTLPVGT